jgi:hypothetical protein
MPVYRHECRACGCETHDLLSLSAPEPEHCGQAMRRLMPTRVAAKVVNPSAGPSVAPPPAKLKPVQQAPLMSSPDAGKLETHRRARDPVTGPTIPMTKWAKPFEACSADQRTERWRDTCEAMTAHQVECLEASGVDAREARLKASATQQKITEQARAGYMHPSGVN